MSRTYRKIPYKHYWGCTKNELKRRIDEYEPNTSWGQRYLNSMKRDYLLFGTESRNYTCNTHYYFNRVNRIGRALERNKLRPHLIDEDYEFDDSHYRARYKGVWW